MARRPWREAESLRVLHATINRLAPNRDKASDGMIGNADHAANWEASDHNPWLVDKRGVGVVRARDVDHDPAGGCDCRLLAASLVKLFGRHPAMGRGSLIIFEDRIISFNRLSEGWRPYPGKNEHRSHLHLSVGTSGYDAKTPWPIQVKAAAKPSRITQARALLRAVVADKGLTARRRARAQAALDVLPAA